MRELLQKPRGASGKNSTKCNCSFEVLKNLISKMYCGSGESIEFEVLENCFYIPGIFVMPGKLLRVSLSFIELL